MTTLQSVGRAGPAVVPRSRLSGPGWRGRGQHHLGVSTEPRGHSTHGPGRHPAEETLPEDTRIPTKHDLAVFQTTRAAQLSLRHIFEARETFLTSCYFTSSQHFKHHAALRARLKRCWNSAPSRLSKRIQLSLSPAETPWECFLPLLQLGCVCDP